MRQLILAKGSHFLVASIIFLFTPWTSYGQSLQIDVLDVGQGDSILITSPDGHHILIDGGPDQSVIDQLDEVLPFWDRNIDVILPSHPQADHINGLVYVLQRMQVGAIMDTPESAKINAYIAIKKLIEQKNISEINLVRGKVVNIGGDVTLESLWPPPQTRWGEVDDPNDVAEVLLLKYGYFKALFTGDAGANIDRELINLGNITPIDLLKVGHHGSKTGTDQQFLNKIHPVASVISVGSDNRYGHPAPSTLRQLSAVGSDIWRTDNDGRIKIVVNGAGISVYSTK